jgi:hypothetical protein
MHINILQYFHLDLRRDLVHNIYGIVIYISYYDYVFSLKMACIALHLVPDYL